MTHKEASHKVPVKDYQFTEKMSVNELVGQMDKAWGFTAGKLATGVGIMESMINQKGCVKFLSFTADIVATGTRGVIRELVKRKLVDIIITTCGTLDHDVARCWKDYYKGSFIMNDSKLHQEGLNRLGNVLVPNDSYGIIIEKKIFGMLEELYKEGKHELSTSELCREIGLRCCNESSILYWAAKNNIPVFVPGITDGSVGYQLWFFSQDHNDFRINLLKDEGDLNNIVFDAKKSGALIVGGGISKAPHDMVEPIQRRLRLRRLHYHSRRMGWQPQRCTSTRSGFMGKNQRKSKTNNDRRRRHSNNANND